MILEEDHARLSQNGLMLAGGRDDLTQRALVYLNLYRSSGGNHVFPLLAAHGALWASGHFKRGIRISRIVARLELLGPERRQERLQEVSAFANAMKDINRRVCAETYTAYHMTRLHGEASELGHYVPDQLIDALNTCHHAAKSGSHLPSKEKRNLFEAFFLWEQDTIVGPGVDAAVKAITWPSIRALVLRPPIGFSYFGPLSWLWFKSFAEKVERVQRGLEAVSIAERRGWDHVEHSLVRYPGMPKKIMQDPDACFATIANHFGIETDGGKR